MSAANIPAFVPLKKSDYGDDGLGSKDALDKFFTQLNTQNQALLGTLGGSLNFGNLNGQAFEFDLQTPATDWVDMTLTAPIVKFGSGLPSWAPPGYRVDGYGRLYCRGLLAANSAIPNNQVIWTYPNAKLGPRDGSSNTGRLFAIPMFVGPSGTLASMRRIDANTTALQFQPTGTFATAGLSAWTNIPLATNFSSAGTNPAYAIDGNGRVYIRGNVGNSIANVTTGQVMGTLPAGFRPSAQMDYSGIFDGVTNPESPGFLRIETNGDIKIFFAVAAQKMNSCPLAQASFDTGGGTVSDTPGTIVYASLDAVSWETIGAPPTMSCFPLNVRTKDGAVVKDVFLTSILDSDQSKSQFGPVTACGWLPNQTKSGFPNTFSITSIPGVLPGRKYHVRGVALFQ